MIRRDYGRGSGVLPALMLSVTVTALAACSGQEASESEVASNRQTRDFAAAPANPAASKPGNTPGKAAPSNPAQSGPAFVAGQLVVKFKSDAQAGVTDDVHACLAQGRSFASITADGSASLDAHVRRHGIFAATSLVRGRHGLSTAAARAMLRERGTKTAQAKNRARIAPSEDLVNVYRLDLPAAANLEAALHDLQSDPHVEYVHPNYLANLVYTPNDPYWSSAGSWGQPRADLWDLKLMHTDQAWNVSRGSGVVVAVVDTGVDITHPDLAGNVWTNPGEIPDNGIDDDGNGFIDDVHGWSVLSNSNQIDDSIGHGTHLAGTIAAQDNNGIGMVGVAPDATIMPVQVFSESSDAFTLSQGILYAVHNGADVINNSWEMCSGNCPSAGVVEDAVRTAHAAGVVVVFAAGNETADIRLRSPQNLPESIVVSATTPGDTRADFSNFGLLDVGAPGSGDPNDANVDEPSYGILSLKASNCIWYYCMDDRLVGDGYVRFAGTSMAAPHAAGVAALILGLHPKYSPEQVRQVMRRIAVDANHNGYDTDLGYGRVDVAKLASEPTPLEALIQAPLLVQTSQVTIAGSANGDKFQKYVLEVGKGTAPTAWTTLVTSTTAVSAGTLATWDVSKLPDGDYTLRLSAYKTDGTRYEDLHLLTLDRVAITSPAANSSVGGGDLAIVGMASPGNFKSYTLRVQSFTDGTPVNANLALSNGGKQPVANGVLGVWHAQSVPAGHYRILLDVTNSDGSVISRNVILIVDSMLHSGWPVNLTFYTYQGRGPAPPAEPIAIADLDGDGKAEVIAGYGEKVTVFKGDGTILAGWPQTMTTATNSYPSLKSMPVVGDVDGDGLKEVVAVTTDGTLFVWGPTGVLKPGWPRAITYTTDWGTMGAWLSLSLADVDRNGVLDIVATDGAQTGVHVLKGNGSYLPGWPVALGGAINTPATVADLNKDGKNEVVVGVDSTPSQLVVLSAKGAVQSGWPRTVLTSSNGSTGLYPVVGDLDDDGDLEIAAVVCDGGGDPSQSKVVLFHHNGQPLTSWFTDAVQTGPLVLADLDGDGSLEVLLSLMKMDGTGGLYAWNRKGGLMPGWPLGNPSYTPMFNAPIVVDLDGDGRGEVIAAREQELWSDELQINYGFPVQAYRYDGSVLPEMARPAYGAWSGWDGSPGVADTDGDGRLELVWTEVREQGLSSDLPWPRVFTWDLTTPTSNAQPWPMYRADARHSGVAQTVVPIEKLTQRNQVHHISGLARFQLQTGSAGVIQLKHPWQAVVKYALGSDLLKQTTLGWGEQLTVGANQTVLLRVLTTSATDVSIDWW